MCHIYVSYIYTRLVTHRRHKQHRRRTRNRRRGPDGTWEVHARVERLAEAVVLLLLVEGPAHGYDLADRLGSFGGSDVDYGNLYRLLRVLEEEGMVSSQWRDDEPGPAKRIYHITDEGEMLLAGWAHGLRTVHDRVGAFLERFEAQRGS